MTIETLDKANLCKGKIREAKSSLEYIKRCEKGFTSKRSFKLSIPYSYDIDSDLYIHDLQLKKNILNLIKIHLIKTVQESEKELESL